MPTETRATYRIQLQPTFGFDDAAGIVPYLEQLGVSHMYTSPYLQAAPGSTHGYDVVDFNRVNEELGGLIGHARLLRALTDGHMGHILDFVPNHMAIAGEANPWWWDVLESGLASRYASHFDVDWDPPEARLRDRVLIPILAAHYGEELETGQLQVERADGALRVRYRDQILPASPRSAGWLLKAASERSRSDELGFIADALGDLPITSDRVAIRRRHRDKEILRALLSQLCREQPKVAADIAATIVEVNRSPEALATFLEMQNYRLAHWRAAQHEMDYRRFFDINTLVGLRVEDDRVFSEVHRLVSIWLDGGLLDGLRIDHPDGLRDPTTYFERLHAIAPGAWIVVEKVLEPEERLPADWPVAGTTGYDFLARVGGLFVDPAGEEALTGLYTDFTGETADYVALVREKKLQVLDDALRSDLDRLVARFLAICEQNYRYRDHTRHDLREVLREFIASFPVYRTYARPQDMEVSEADSHVVGGAIEAVRRQRPDLDKAILDFLHDLLTLRSRGELEADFVLRLQQLTGPVMAKGVEDTTFYCYNRLIALNEVGGDPSRFGTSVAEFHRACTETQERWPRSMLATSTHDTKRGEDVRARIALLSEIPKEWGSAVRRWSAMNENLRHDGAPDPNAEYLLYQTLVGAWPLPVERAVEYMRKAAREAKVRTSWTDPDPAYEQALESFVRSCMADGEFIQDLKRFVTPLVEPGRVNSLAQTLIKLTAPGVPDIYQGTELWDNSLVDPDNRRPVDFVTRQRLLMELDRLTPKEIWDRIEEGLPKLWLIHRALGLRAQRPASFGPESAYAPIEAMGKKADHVVAFSRGGDIVTIVPRLVLGLDDGWRDTSLPLGPGSWRDVLTNEELGPVEQINLADLLARFPIALLARTNA